MKSFVYRNESNVLLKDNHYLKFILLGEGRNTQALGTKITLHVGKEKLYLEQMPMRGFESTVDARPNFGLGKTDRVDKVVVEWPDGRVTELDSVKANQTIQLKQSEARSGTRSIANPPLALFELVEGKLGLGFRHTENDFVDFDRDRLIYHMLSVEGSKMALGDVNKDGLDDIYFGGAKDQSGELYVQSMSGTFSKATQHTFEVDKISEDMGSTFFDADGDGDMDLYVCSGGNEFSPSSSALLDRLYFNDGSGHFTKTPQTLPAATFASTSCVYASDYDNDGDQDLFVGARLIPFAYGMPTDSYLLQNDGKGNFSNVTDVLAPGLLKIGMVTDACWADIDGDKDSDLLVVGEWMPIKVFINDQGKLNDVTDKWGMQASSGWWNTIKPADLDDDGDMDFVVGNHGLNSRFKATNEKPVSMMVNDFDRNGSIEQIICVYFGDTSYPMVLRHDLLSQIPSLKKKYLKYENYSNQRFEDIFSEEQRKGTLKLEANTLASSVLINQGGRFELKELPVEAQFSPIYAICIEDIDLDNKKDLIIGGNLYKVKPEAGRYDASEGLFLKGKGDATFSSVPNRYSGIDIDGQVRDLRMIHTANGRFMIVNRNDESVLIYKIK
jgi:hypothetical protein